MGSQVTLYFNNVSATCIRGGGKPFSGRTNRQVVVALGKTRLLTPNQYRWKLLLRWQTDGKWLPASNGRFLG